MLGLAAVPAVLMFVGLLSLPESPRWLFGKGREDEALEVMRRTRPADEIEDEAEEIKETIEAESAASYRDLLSPPIRPALRVGIGVPVINQLSASTRSSTTRRRSSSSRGSATAPRSSARSASAWSTSC